MLIMKYPREVVQTDFKKKLRSLREMRAEIERLKLYLNNPATEAHRLMCQGELERLAREVARRTSKTRGVWQPKS